MGQAVESSVGTEAGRCATNDELPAALFQDFQAYGAPSTGVDGNFDGQTRAVGPARWNLHGVTDVRSLAGHKRPVDQDLPLELGLRFIWLRQRIWDEGSLR